MKSFILKKWRLTTKTIFIKKSPSFYRGEIFCSVQIFLLNENFSPAIEVREAQLANLSPLWDKVQQLIEASVASETGSLMSISYGVTLTALRLLKSLRLISLTWLSLAQSVQPLTIAWQQSLRLIVLRASLQRSRAYYSEKSSRVTNGNTEQLQVRRTRLPSKLYAVYYLPFLNMLHRSILGTEQL